MWKTTIHTPVGQLQAFANDHGLRGLLWPESDVARFGDADYIEPTQHPIFATLANQLNEYFRGTRRQFDLLLEPVGTAFQRSVWNALGEIPFGETRTYTELAATIGRPTAVRAVGAANGRNPISIIIPCHRVIGANGSLTGFAGGIEVKRFLLERESRRFAEKHLPLGEVAVSAAGEGIKRCRKPLDRPQWRF